MRPSAAVVTTIGGVVEPSLNERFDVDRGAALLLETLQLSREHAIGRSEGGPVIVLHDQPWDASICSARATHPALLIVCLGLAPLLACSADGRASITAQPPGVASITAQSPGGASISSAHRVQPATTRAPSAAAVNGAAAVSGTAGTAAVTGGVGGDVMGPGQAAARIGAVSGGANASASASLAAGTHAAAVVDASIASDAAVPASDAGSAASDPSNPSNPSNPSMTPIAKAGEIHGVNWADTRDNFVRGNLQLSGLDSSADTYDTVRAKASQIVTQFRDQLGANTIRIPINEPTVASAWWDAYKGVIDATTAMSMNVIIAYWAVSGGRPQSEAAFKSMWQKVVWAYAHNNRVLFDIHNEPSGFGSSWNDEAARWLGYFPDLPRARVIVAGTGSDDNVVPVGKDSRFDGCLLELHYYEFWHKDWKTRKQWRDAVSAALGEYSSRTIVGEWGAAMSTGLDYNSDTPDNNSSIAYINAMADLMHERGMGSCYWPGLRDEDTYAMMKRDAAGLTLSVVNRSGQDRLRWAWNL